MKSLRFNNFTVGVLLTTVSILIYFLDVPFFHLLELKSYDLKLRSRGVRPVSNEVVIAAIDEKSLGSQGRWPWPRALHGELVDRLVENEAAVIGYNIFFPEKDASIPIKQVKDVLDQNKSENIKRETLVNWLDIAGGSDRRFADAIRISDRTILAYIIYPSDSQAGEKIDLMNPSVLNFMRPSGYSNGRLFLDTHSVSPVRSISSVELSLPLFLQNARATGFAHYIPDSDGSIRWAPLVMRFQNMLFPPLALHVLSEAEKLPLNVEISSAGIRHLHVGYQNIPVNPRGDMLINYYGPPFTFSHIPATDIISGAVGKDQLRGKIVLVGGTAAGTHDNYPSPWSPAFPEVEILASVIENILQNDFLVRPSWVSNVDLAVIAGTGLLFALAFMRYRSQTVAVFLALGIFMYLAFDFFMFYRKGIWVNTVYPVFSQGFVFFGISIYRLAFEERQKRFIQGAFSKYLSPVMVNELVRRPELLKSGGEERYLTVLFQDLEGFTPVSENLPPAELAKLMNSYFTEMTEIILNENGTINQYAGDLIMASFGAPVPSEDHSRRAVRAALKMQQRLHEWSRDMESRGLPRLKCRTGINTGKMFFGNLGSQQVYYYSVMGDAVNTAARLETANKFYGTHLLISESTHSHLDKGMFRTRILDVIKVKGKSVAVKIYEVYGDSYRKISPEGLAYYETYQQGYESYLSKNFDAARERFSAALALRPGDKAAEAMLRRIDGLDFANLPKEWDGSVAMETK